MLVRIIKSWAGPDFLYQTPEGKGVWDGIRFTFEPVEACDLLIVLNNQLQQDVAVQCPPENVWALMQEPYYAGLTDWMVEKHDCFAKVFTHHRAAYKNSKYIFSHPAIPWHVHKTYDELMSVSASRKSKNLSWIVGDALDLPGHIKRRSFLEYIKGKRSLDLDLYGKKINFIKDKWDGLTPYRYSLAVENTSGVDYWTEKVADCFLAWTVPIYHGCPNLETYFPEESFIRINIEEPEASLERIRRVIREDNWEKRLPALEEARRLVLQRYQFFPHMTRYIQEWKASGGEKALVTIPAYRRSQKAKAYRAFFKIRREIRRLLLRWR